MSILGIDLGGTKLSSAVFNEDGQILFKEILPIGSKQGAEVGMLITSQIKKLTNDPTFQITSIGICVPGISNSQEGTVWVPNIQGWQDYALLKEVKAVAGTIPVTIDCDRAGYVLGEVWQGKAKGCRNAVFLAVGTGIGAGLLVNGAVFRGAHNTAGAIGWMALNSPFEEKYVKCGCFEHYASGEGIASLTRKMVNEQTTYQGQLKDNDIECLTSHNVFTAFHNNDPIAVNVVHTCVEYWGMAVANLVSLLDPEMIIFGGGIFGPAIPTIPLIKEEARKWAQPISMSKVKIEVSALGGDAGVYGAGFLALENLRQNIAANVQ